MKKLIALLLIVTLFVPALRIPAAADDASVQTIPLQILANSFDTYKDINVNSWYKSALDGVVTFGLMDGISAGEFSPDGVTDRATLVTALYRMTGSPKVTEAAPFVDLTEDWYKNAAAWAYETEVVKGTTDTTFSPDTKITREQMAAIFYRYMTYMNGDISAAASLDTYPDVYSVSTWAKEPFAWACAEGLITGSKGADGIIRLAPKEGATRAQVATIVMRFAEKYQDIFEISDNPDEDDNYKKFNNFGSMTHTTRYFALKNAQSALRFDVPEKWKFTLVDGVYVITENNVEVGRLYPGKAPDTDGWKIVASEENRDNGADNIRYTEKYGSGVRLRFRYRYVFNYEESGEQKKYTLTLDYTKVKDWTAKRILTYSLVEGIFTDPGYGKLSNLKDKTVYIVGNSFVGYSKIPEILSEMSRKHGRDLDVWYSWLPNSRITHFTKSSEIMSAIRSGKYDALFLCGMYAPEDSTDIDKILEACKNADVQLVLFPAHNEKANVVQMTKARHPELVIVDWKQEIESLIGEGRSFWDFCYDDGPKHSNEVAGYVGAHMIYRAIYGKNPITPVSKYVDQGDVDRVLGDYVREPVARRIAEKQINYFG